MTRDSNQPPATTGQQAGRSDAERQEKINQLFQRRSKLSADEAALLREPDVFGQIIAAHHTQVWNLLRRRRLERHDADGIYQDVFVALHDHIVEKGFPKNAPALVTEIATWKILGHVAGRNRLPPTEPLPSSGSEERVRPRPRHGSPRACAADPPQALAGAPGGAREGHRERPVAYRRLMNWQQGKTEPLGHNVIAKAFAALPFIGNKVGAGTASFPKLSLKRYASLRAELSMWPTPPAAILLRYYVVNEAAQRALEERWQAQFAASPKERLKAITNEHIGSVP